MKRNILALSIQCMMGGLDFAGKNPLPLALRHLELSPSRAQASSTSEQASAQATAPSATHAS